MKAIHLMLVMGLCQSRLHGQTVINPLISGQNYWMSNKNPSPHTGIMESYWSEITASGVKCMRIGGHFYDGSQCYDPSPSNGKANQQQLLNMINDLKSRGIEPIVQVPIDDAKSVADNATKAALLVDFVNVQNPNSKVKYWAIGNEPDLWYTNNGFGDYSTDAKIAEYTKACSAAMKAVVGTIKIIGPTLSFYDFNRYHTFMGTGANSIMGSLPNSSLFFIDIISFNTYPISLSTLQSTGGRQSIIGHLRSSYQYAAILDDIANNRPAGRNATNLEIVITEANISLQQDVSNNGANIGAAGVGPGSFLGGQFWAEMMAISMEKGVSSHDFWSVIEGTSGDSYLEDRGFLSKQFNGKRRPSYFHYYEMAGHFKGTYYPATITNGANIKAWAAQQGDRIAVMILNQNKGTSNGSQPFKVRFKNTSITPLTSGTDIYFDIPNTLNNTNGFYYNSSSPIVDESSVLLIFTCTGNFNTRKDYTISDASSSNDNGFHQTETGSTSLIGGPITFNPSNYTLKDPGEIIQFTFGPSNYKFTWDPGSHCPPDKVNDTQVNLAVCAGGTSIYTFTATDPEGCTTTQEFEVHPSNATSTNTSLVIYSFVSNVTKSNCGAMNGAATASCGNCGSNPTYLWDGLYSGTTSGDVNTITGLAPGSHTVVITDGSSSKKLQLYVGITGTQPAVFAGFDFSAPRGCPVNLVATPNLSGHTWQWFTGNSTVPFTSGRIAGVTHWLGETYRVKVTSPSGCTNEDRVFVARDEAAIACLPYAAWNAQIPCDPQFNATYREMDEIATETVTGMLTIEKNTYFDKVLTVTNGGTLNIKNCIVAFSPSAHIVISGTATVTYSNVFFVPCGTGVFPFTIGSGTGIQLISRNSAFEGRDGFKFTNMSGGQIQDNVFSRMGTGIDLTNCKDFEISTNMFYKTATGLRSSASTTVVQGLLESNLFDSTATAIEIGGGNHSALAIACNTLGYSEYGIYSEGTLSSFGTTGLTSGNIFHSSSTNVNHQIKHTGNPITYYCGPLHSFTLSNTAGNVTVGSSNLDADCPDYFLQKIAAPSIDHTELVPVFQVYPNPSTGQLNIVCGLTEEAFPAKFFIIEPGTGRIMLSKAITAAENKFRISVSDFSAGVYLGLLRTNTGSTYYSKIIKTD
jgi:hypothetical protein